MKLYKSIKQILKKQIANNVNAYWNWIEGENEEFVHLYKVVNEKNNVYTAKQLLEKIDEKIKYKQKNA